MHKRANRDAHFKLLEKSVVWTTLCSVFRFIVKLKPLDCRSVFSCSLHRFEWLTVNYYELNISCSFEAHPSVRQLHWIRKHKRNEKLQLQVFQFHASQLCRLEDPFNVSVWSRCATSLCRIWQHTANQPDRNWRTKRECKRIRFFDRLDAPHSTSALCGVSFFYYSSSVF